MKSSIQVRNLSKCYRIGGPRRTHYRTLRDTLADSARSAWGRVRRLGRPGPRPESETLLALSDVSFDVRPGEAVGIIGRNGAGKSTLLKILSQITEPTSGRVEVRGRMASLLEVGTGFHPELTGRENIYLNGAVLGMTRREITRKFDEIVEFAEVERFLDTPVKRYSSGMFVRLAFAVAAHLEQEILLVDEVLAVGDVAFQKKCLRKMGEVADGGRTVLFVSHNIAAIESLCQTGILLEQGRVTGQGSVEAVLAQYMQAMQKPVGAGLGEDDEGRVFSFKSAELLRNGTEPTGTLQTGDSVTLRVTMECRQPQTGMYLGAGIVDELGRLLVSFHSMEAGLTLDEELVGPVRLDIELPQLLLLPGLFHVRLIALTAKGAWDGHVLQEIPSAISFQVLPRDYSGNGHCHLQKHGTLLMPFRMRAESGGKQWVARVLAGNA